MDATPAGLFERHTLDGRALKRAAVAFLFAVTFCAGTARAQTNDPSEEVLETSGALTLARRRDGEAVTILFKMHGHTVAEKSASPEGDAYTSASVFGGYPKSSPKYVVVALSTGSLVCGTKFTVVDFTHKEPARVSEDFGNCSDVPRAVYRGDTLTLTFPAGPRKPDPGAHYVGPRQVWTYTYGRLRKVGGRR